MASYRANKSAAVAINVIAALWQVICNTIPRTPISVSISLVVVCIVVYGIIRISWIPLLPFCRRPEPSFNSVELAKISYGKITHT